MCEPVGLAEIAARLDQRPQTCAMWWYRTQRGEMRRSPMPAPKWTVSGQPAWEWRQVERWAMATGRYTPQ